MNSCPHIKLENLKVLQSALKEFYGDKKDEKFECNKCNSSLYLLFCAHCFQIGCTRNKHNRMHFQEKNHFLAYNIEKRHLFCYSCEDYIRRHDLKNLYYYESHLNLESKSGDKRTESLDNSIFTSEFFNDSNKNQLRSSIRSGSQNFLFKPNTDSVLLDKLNDKIYKKYPCIIIKGFGNLGNTCYINSLLSILIYSDEFKNYFLGNKHCISSCWEENCILCGFKEIYTDLYSKLPGITFHNFFYRLIRKDSYFLGSKQQDVHELFIHLADLIHKTGDSVGCKCLMHSIFYGMNKIHFSCLACNQRFIKQEEFFDLSLQITESVSTSLKKFFDSEIVTNLNCDKCGVNAQFDRKYEASILPKLLCLHIKRFEFKNGRITKITDVIHNDNIILLGSTYFYLYGFIVHEGDINSGHYLSYVRINNKFKCFNDENIRNVKARDVQVNSSYLLFYRKID